MKCDNCNKEMDMKALSTFRFTDGEFEHGWCLCYDCANKINNLLSENKLL